MYGYLFQLHENTLSIYQFIYNTLYKNMENADFFMFCSKNNPRGLKKNCTIGF